MRSRSAGSATRSGARFIAKVREVLADAWSEVELVDLIARWDALTFGAREAGNGEPGSEDIAALKVFVAGRRRALEAALDTLPPAGPPLRDAVCAEPAGTVAVTFDTRWGTLDLDNLFRTGSGTFTVTSEVLPPLVIGMVGAKAGVPADMSLGTAPIIVAGQVVGAGFMVSRRGAGRRRRTGDGKVRAVDLDRQEVSCHSPCSPRSSPHARSRRPARCSCRKRRRVPSRCATRAWSS